MPGVKVKIDTSEAIKKCDDLKKSLEALGNQTKKTEKTTSEFGQTMKQVMGFIATAQLANMIKDIAMAAARYETLGVAMNIVGVNAGYTANQMDMFAKGLQRAGISMSESRQSLTRMAQAQLDLNQSSKLARIAQDAAVIANINSSESFERMIIGIQQGQPLILRAIGINVSFEEAYKKVEKQIGAVRGSLTEEQKVVARQNEVLEKGTRIAGTYEAAMNTAGKQVGSFKRYVEDFQVKMGIAFGPATTAIVKEATRAMKEFTKEVERPEIQQALAGIGKTAVQSFENVIKAAKGPALLFVSIMEGWNSLPTIIQQLGLIPALYFGWQGVAVLAGVSAAIGLGNDLVALMVLVAKENDLIAKGKLDPKGLKDKTFAQRKLIVDSIEYPYGARSDLAEQFANNPEKKAQFDERTVSKAKKSTVSPATETQLKAARASLEKYYSEAKFTDAGYYTWKVNELKREEKENIKNTMSKTMAHKIYIDGIKKLDKEAFDHRAELGKKDITTDDWRAINADMGGPKYVSSKEAEAQKTYYDEAKFRDAGYFDWKMDALEKQRVKEYSEAVQNHTSVELVQKAYYLRLQDLFKESQDNKIQMAKNYQSEWEAINEEMGGPKVGMKVEDTSKEKLEIYQKMYDGLKGYEKDYAEVSLQLLREQKQAELTILNKGVTDYEEIKKNQLLVDKWYAQRKKEIDYQTAVNGDDFVDGALAEYQKMEDEKLKMGQAGATAMRSVFTNMRNSFSEIFYDSWTGKLRSAEDYFKSFANSLAKTWADLCSQMIADWIRQQVITGITKVVGAAAGGSFGGGGATAGGEGMTAAGWTGTSAGGSASVNASGWHKGGIPGKDKPAFERLLPASYFINAPRYHGGVGPNERAAVIKDDEGVFTQEQMKAMGKKSGGVKVEIANIVSPEMFDSYMSTTRGQNAVINVISGRGGTLKRIIQMEG